MSGLISYQRFVGIQIRVKTFPKELLEIKHIYKLKIEFVGEINIPDEIQNIMIDRLELKGSISQEGIKRIKLLLPNTELIINN